LNNNTYNCDMEEQLTIKGDVTIRGYDEHGKEVLCIEKRNLVVNAGKAVLVQMLRNGTGLAANGVAFGTSAASPVLGDTAITGAFTKALSGSSNPQPNQALFNWALEYAENNGMTIREIGLICDRTGTNTLFSRLVFAPIVKTASLRLVGSWRITF
jgi:hypothetical protein